jgi:tripartite-type tricarboxylate transporter receptor subunit TctC
VINVAVSPYALALHTGVPAASVSELSCYARAHPNVLPMAPLNGSASHLAAELFKSMAGMRWCTCPTRA